MILIPKQEKERGIRRLMAIVEELIAHDTYVSACLLSQGRRTEAVHTKQRRNARSRAWGVRPVWFLFLEIFYFSP